MNAVRLFALLVYTFGVFAYGAMLALWIAAMGRGGWGGRRHSAAAQGRGLDATNGVLLALSFVWFVCNVASLVLSMTTLGGRWQIDVATIFLGFAFPPLIMHVSWAEVSHRVRCPVASGWRAALWPAYIVSLALPTWAVFLLSRGRQGGSMAIANQILSVGLVAAFIASALYCIALLTRHAGTAPLPARDHQSRRSLLILFGGMIAVFIALYAITAFRGDVRPTTALAGELVEVVAKSLPLVFVFVGTYYENRFQFFDLFVKRGAGFVIAAVVLTLWLAAILPVLQPVISTWAAPWIFAITLLPAVAVIPWLYAVVSGALDRRWLGRRFTPQAALSHFMGALRSATTEPELVEQAEAGLREVFGAPATVSLRPVGDPSATVEVPIRSGDRVLGYFRMGPRVNDTPYFSEDVHLLGSLAGVFTHVLENLRLQEQRLEGEQRARDLSLQASRSELKALRAQINPHFLFNALNSIAGLIHRDPAVADRTIEQLAEVFRYALRGAESEWAVLDEELEFVRAYLDVERARFGERLITDVRIDPAVRGARVPTMVVQTLVENAVKHGASAVRTSAQVLVDARAQDDRLVIVVADNGPGFLDAESCPAPRERGGYGLVNVRQRLEGYFGSTARLSVERTGTLTVVSISMPIVRHEPRASAAHEVSR